MPTLPNPVRGVIFDIDGVLVDSESGYDRASCAALESLGYEPEYAIRMDLVGLPLAACESVLIAGYGPSFAWPDFVDAYRHHSQFLPPIPPMKKGVGDSLMMLRDAGVKIAFVTNDTASSARAVLEAHRLILPTEPLVTQNDVHHRKPEPDAYLLAGAMLEERLSHLVAAEDSPVGLHAAIRAGLFAAFIPDFGPPPSEWGGAADGIFDSVADLVSSVLRG